MTIYKRLVAQVHGIEADTYLCDEIDDGSERNPHIGYMPIDRTMIPEKLMAWRDAAAKAALEAR